MERREFLGWLGSAGAAAFALSAGSGASMAQSGKPASPDTTANPAMPPADQPPGPDALDLASIAKRRYGKFLSGEQAEELTKALDRGVQGGTALRKAKLANSDEPDFIFHALD